MNDELGYDPDNEWLELPWGNSEPTGDVTGGGAPGAGSNTADLPGGPLGEWGETIPTILEDLGSTVDDILDIFGGGYPQPPQPKPAPPKGGVSFAGMMPLLLLGLVAVFALRR